MRRLSSSDGWASDGLKGGRHLSTAVCLTGKVSEGGSADAPLLALSALPGVEVFGVQPLGGGWENIHRQIRWQGLSGQAPCELNLSHTLRTQLRCEAQMSCARDFAQELCDHAQCETLLVERERQVGESFDKVVSVDAAFLGKLSLSQHSAILRGTWDALHPPGLPPSPSLSAALHTPLAIGAQTVSGNRSAMRAYLTRAAHADDESLWQLAPNSTFVPEALALVTPSEFVRRALRHQHVTFHEMGGNAFFPS